MKPSIAYLGPPGTYTEAAALSYAGRLPHAQRSLCPYPSIAQVLKATAAGQTHLAVVPIENSIEGSVTVTLDTLWQLDTLQVHQALVLPIVHALVSRAKRIQDVQTIYSIPQALSQCQGWLERFLPQVQLIPTSATTEALRHLETDPTLGAIASQRAAQLYNLPVLACPVQDYPDNCTRFWVLGQDTASSPTGEYLAEAVPLPRGNAYTSIAFSVPANLPGALVKPLQVFAQRQINLSRIESRPSKRSLGDYVFFIDLEADLSEPVVQSALGELTLYTEVLKVFGSYTAWQVEG